VTHLCHNTDGGATGVRSGRRPQIPFLPLVKHTSKVLDVLRTLARDPERSKYRTAACRPDAKWSAAAGRPTSPHLNRDSSPVRFSAISNGHFRGGSEEVMFLMGTNSQRFGFSSFSYNAKIPLRPLDGPTGLCA